MKRIKVLIVDDSIMFRQLLVNGLQMDPAIEVVATAGNPFEARDAIIKYNPDVMTLDIQLPKMDGIEFLRKLMPQYPLPVVVISALNNKVFEAMNAGAVDFVNKPAGLNREQLGDFIRNELITKIKIASTAKVGNLKRAKQSTSLRPSNLKKSDMIIAIGASTGGTEATYEVLKELGTDIPGIVIVQHMPADFTKMYAEHLNNKCRIAVKEAKTGDRVQQGLALLAPGDAHMRLVKMSDGYQVECRPGPKVSGHCPSVDVLFDSVAHTAKSKALGIILTGMGADGARGLLAMRQAGAETIGQDEATCVVYGMPKVAYEIGAVKYQSGLTGIPHKIYNILNNQ